MSDHVPVVTDAMLETFGDQLQDLVSGSNNPIAALWYVQWLYLEKEDRRNFYLEKQREMQNVVDAVHAVLGRIILHLRDLPPGIARHPEVQALVQKCKELDKDLDDDELSDSSASKG